MTGAWATLGFWMSNVRHSNGISIACALLCIQIGVAQECYNADTLRYFVGNSTSALTCIDERSGEKLILGGYVENAGEDALFLELNADLTIGDSIVFSRTGDNRFVSLFQFGANSAALFGTALGAGNNDFWMVLLDSNNVPRLDTTWDVYAEQNRCFSATIVDTNAFVLVGSTTHILNGKPDGCIMRVLSSGARDTTIVLGGDRFDQFTGVAEDGHGGIVCVGYTESLGDTCGDIWVVHIDDHGTILAESAIPMSGYQAGMCIVRGADLGTFYISGVADDSCMNGTNYQGILAKVTESGDVLWSVVKSFAPATLFSSTYATEDGGCIVAGHAGTPSNSRDGRYQDIDMVLARFTPLGRLIWVKRYSGNSLFHACNAAIRRSTEQWALCGTGVNISGSVASPFSGLLALTDPDTFGFVIESPNGGDSIPAGGSSYVRWYSYGTPNALRLDIDVLYPNDWTELALVTSSDGCASVDFPCVISNAVRLRLQDEGECWIDVSDADFDLTSALISPKLVVGVGVESIKLTWSSYPCNRPVVYDVYSTQDFSNPFVFIETTSDTSYNVPLSPAVSARFFYVVARSM